MKVGINAVGDRIVRPNMPELDSVRGVAILSVLFFHGFGFTYSPEKFSGIARWFVTATLPGWAGVNLFFVLSGFLITGILLDTKGSSDYFRRFYTRRALRILPAYYALLIILFIVPHTPWFMGRHFTWRFALFSAFFMANLTPLFGIRVQYGVLWSLAVEEHFYLLWPFLVRVLSKTSIAVCAGLIVFGVPVLRALTFSLGYTAGPGYTWLVADGLALGALLAVLIRIASQERRAAKYFSSICISASLVLLIAGRSFGVPHASTITGEALRPTALNLFFAGCLAIVLLIGTGPYRFLVRWRILGFFGRISYGLYLIHMLAFDFVDTMFAKYLPQFTLQADFVFVSIRFLLAAGLAVGIAFLSREYFEEWFLQFKHRHS